jgi:hypothetical protein
MHALRREHSARPRKKPTKPLDKIVYERGTTHIASVDAATNECCALDEKRTL